MPRPKQSMAPTSAPTEEQVAQLTAAVQSLTQQVETLAGHVEIVHQVLDEIREDIGWALQNDSFSTRRSDEWLPVTHITSMPKDPCAPDFHERVNRFSAKDLPLQQQEDSTPSSADNQHQGELWES